MADKTPSSNQQPMELIERMLKLMDERGLIELEFEQADVKIRLRKPDAAMARPSVEYIQMPAAQQGHQQSTPATPAPAVPAADRPTIDSPMVGTFYTAPAPDAPAFVEVGQTISVGQVVCIVEAMKLMNEIKSEVSGKIVEVLVQNGESIEFGQPLYVIEPSK